MFAIMFILMWFLRCCIKDNRCKPTLKVFLNIFLLYLILNKGQDFKISKLNINIYVYFCISLSYLSSGIFRMIPELNDYSSD